MHEQITAHYAANFGRLVKSTYYRVGVHAMAEDIVQETYTRALKYYNPQVRELNPWLHTLLNNTLRDYKRAERNLCGVEIVDDDWEEVKFQDWEEHFIEDVRSLVAGIDQEDERTICHYSFLQGLTPREIAAITDSPYKRIENVKRKYREIIIAKFGGRHE